MHLLEPRKEENKIMIERGPTTFEINHHVSGTNPVHRLSLRQSDLFAIVDALCIVRDNIIEGVTIDDPTCESQSEEPTECDWHYTLVMEAMEQVCKEAGMSVVDKPDVPRVIRMELE
jgi:hypothetical protein